MVADNPLSGQPVRPDLTRFVSVLAKHPRAAPALPISLPPKGRWLLRILARDDRFVFGQYRRHIKVIGYLGTLDRLFGVPVTTRSWSTVAAIARVLEDGFLVTASPVQRPAQPTRRIEA